MKAVLSYYHSSMKTKNRLRDVDHLLMVPFMHVAAPNISKYVFCMHYKYCVGLYIWDFLFKYTQCVIQYLHSPLFVCNEALEKRHLHDAIKLTCNVEINQVLTNWINEINRTMGEWVSQIGCLTSHSVIFQLFMWRHIDVQADGRRSCWTYGQAPNAIDIS